MTTDFAKALKKGEDVIGRSVKNIRKLPFLPCLGVFVVTDAEWVPSVREVRKFGLDGGLTCHTEWAVYFEFVEQKEQPSLVTIEMLRDDIAQLQQENEQLKQRLIEAERNALYWTAFDCPVNRDIAERILRKEN